MLNCILLCIKPFGNYFNQSTLNCNLIHSTLFSAKGSYPGAVMAEVHKVWNNNTVVYKNFLCTLTSKWISWNIKVLNPHTVECPLQTAAFVQNMLACQHLHISTKQVPSWKLQTQLYQQKSPVRQILAWIFVNKWQFIIYHQVILKIFVTELNFNHRLILKCFSKHIILPCFITQLPWLFPRSNFCQTS